MSEEEVPLEATENKEIAKSPPFLEKLGNDYPELARRIDEQLPTWISGVDEISRNPGLGRKLLEHTDYIDKQETQQFIDSITEEASSLIKSGVERVHFLHLGDQQAKSGEYFSRQIISRLPEEYRSKTKMEKAYETPIVPGEHYFLCDDSANSGSQLRTGLGVVRSYAEYRKRPWYDRRTKPANVHVRFLRMTDQAREIVEKAEQHTKNSYVNLDLKTTRMPVVDDVLTEIGVSKEELPDEAFHMLAQAHHGWDKSPVLGFFNHKIQDNMPPAFIPGRNKSEKVKPLLDDEKDVVKPY